MVTYSEENKHRQSCAHCANFIVSCKVFSSVETFVLFWRSFVKENITDRLGKYLRARENMDTAKVFQAVGGKILGLFSPHPIRNP